MDKDENIVLTDVVLVTLGQKFEEKLEVVRYGPLLCHVAWLHEVREQQVVELRVLHRVYLTELLTEDRDNLLSNRLLKLLHESFSQIFATKAHHRNLLINSCVTVFG